MFLVSIAQYLQFKSFLFNFWTFFVLAIIEKTFLRLSAKILLLYIELLSNTFDSKHRLKKNMEEVETKLDI